MSSPLRVLYVTDNPNLGASTRTLLDWIARQDSAGLKFCLALAQPGPLADWLAAHNVPFATLPMPWPDRRHPARYAAPALRIGALIRKWQIDVVHAEHNVYPFVAPVAKLLRRPVICHVHYIVERGFAEWVFQGRRAPDHVVWTSAAQMRECADAVDGIVASSRQSVIHLGIDVGGIVAARDRRDSVRQGWGADDQTVVLGAANAIRPRKRVEDFLHLVHQLAATGPTRVRGVIAGSAPAGDEAYEAEMKALHRRLGLDSSVSWLGNLEPVAPFLHAVDIFVSTSRHETFGMSVCEAMACGKPVAVYDAGSVGEVVGDAGLVVPTEDLNGLTAAVRRLVGDAALRHELGQRARERVATRFDPSVSLGQLSSLYRAVCRDRSKPGRQLS